MVKGLARDRKKMYAYPILCSKCGTAGGTMVKDDKGGYEHQSQELCRVMQLRRKK